MENQLYQHHPTGDNPIPLFPIKVFLLMLSSLLFLLRDLRQNDVHFKA